MQAGSNLPLLTASLPVHPVSLDPAVVSAAQHGEFARVLLLSPGYASPAACQAATPDAFAQAACAITSTLHLSAGC
eukprot:366226-Chlamydomonas_euryale.AAC.7